MAPDDYLRVYWGTLPRKTLKKLQIPVKLRPKNASHETEQEKKACYRATVTALQEC